MSSVELCVPELGMFVVGVTNWSREGVGPKSLEVAFDLYEV
jgi:hypothetical protein